MYNVSQIIKQIHYKFNKKNESEPLFKTKIFNKLDTRRSSGNLNFEIKKIHYGKLISNSKNRTTRYLFNNMIYQSNEECEESPAYRPIEEKLSLIHKSKSEDLNIFKIFPTHHLHNIFFRKLKPTPFEKNINKKKFLRHAILMRQYENSYNELNSFKIRPFSLQTVKQKKINNSFINSKSKSIKLNNKISLCYFNSLKIKQIEKRKQKK